jgi:hypothetical protein
MGSVVMDEEREREEPERRKDSVHLKIRFFGRKRRGKGNSEKGTAISAPRSKL